LETRNRDEKNKCGEGGAWDQGLEVYTRKTKKKRGKVVIYRQKSTNRLKPPTVQVEKK